jgi:tripartite-type tricarboxylate transporter receptor subunit TctC
MMRKKISLALVCLTIGLLSGCSQKTAEAPKETSAKTQETTRESAATYPEKNINFIIPYSAGGGTDSLMRLMTAAMEPDLGKSLVVSNKPGGLGQVGLTELASAKPDGYTIGALSNLDHILVLLTGENVSYDYDSFEYVGAINTTVNVLMANDQNGFKSLDDLVAYAKENPGSVTVAISGKTHIAEVALFEQAAGIDVTTVMQEGGGESLNAVLGGHVDCAVLDKKFVAQVEGQAVTPLASFGGERLSVIGEIPTMKEQGYDVATETYRVITAPKGTPEEVLNRLEASIKSVTETDEFQEKMENMSEIYRFLGRSEVKERLDKDYQAMVTLLKENPNAFE